jgi:hypothetical protein
MDGLVLEAPNELWLDAHQFEVALSAPTSSGDATASGAETPLEIVDAGDDFDLDDSLKLRRFRVQLPQPRSGRFVVTVRFRAPRPDDAPTGVAWQVPILRPFNADSVETSAQIVAVRGIAVAVDAKSDTSTWKAASSPDEALSKTYVATVPATALPLLVTAADISTPSTTIVDRIWLQTWFSGDWRQDRTAIRFRTSGLQATIELPTDLMSADVEVLLDGKPADFVSRTSGRIIVRLTQNGSDDTANVEVTVAEHTLELRSRRQINRGLLTRHHLSPPLLVGASGLSQVYWQVVLPGDEHVVRSPGRLSSASQWQWIGSFWGQQPIMRQTELEEWVGASPQVAPTSAQNEYLYTVLAPVLTIDLVTAPRWLVVLVASLTVLALGLLWLYIPIARRGWVVVAAGCLVAVLAFGYPAPALLLAQASVLGLVVLLISALLKQLTSRPTHWPVTVSGGSSQRQTTPRSESILMPPVAAAASTAPTVPLRISDSQR